MHATPCHAAVGRYLWVRLAFFFLMWMPRASMAHLPPGAERLLRVSHQ